MESNEKAAGAANTNGQDVSPVVKAPLDYSALGALVNDLIVRVHLLEREVKRLKRQQAESYDWSREVTA
ncbi:MAG: hypothetical protein ACLGIN_17090 [Candidatus Sericytochromatia bacterium]